MLSQYANGELTPEGVAKLEAQWAEPVPLTFHSALRKFNTEPSIGASHQISVHFAELQIKKNSCQTLGPASKRVLPDLLFFLEIF
jgi:hypothetical protein